MDRRRRLREADDCELCGDPERDMDVLLQKAVEGRIYEDDVRALAGLLHSGRKLPQLVAICILDCIDWGIASKTARETALGALARMRGRSGPEMGKAAECMMVKIAGAAMGGGSYVQKKEC